MDTIILITDFRHSDNTFTCLDNRILRGEVFHTVDTLLSVTFGSKRISLVLFVSIDSGRDRWKIWVSVSSRLLVDEFFIEIEKLMEKVGILYTNPK